MNRRTFLAGAALSATGSLLHDFASAQRIDPWSEGFARALAANPYLTGYQGVGPDTLFDSEVAFEGTLPDGLQGTFYRNGPALHEMSGLRYHHWFDGDGMVQSFSIGGGRLVHKGRLVLTEKLQAEIKAGKRVRGAFGTTIPGADPITSPDALNVANTSILSHANALLALWEGGSAYRLEPHTLATLGPKVWRSDLKGLPFSAHPKVEADGELWNFGLDTLGSQLVLYRISSAGEVIAAATLRIPDMAMVHDFAVTAKHLVFLLPPLRISLEKLRAGVSFNESHDWIADAPLRVLVVEKSDLGVYRLFELPPGFVFHFGNAWEDAGGIIRFDYVRADDAHNLGIGFRNVMRGVQTVSHPALATQVSLDPNTGRMSQTQIAGSVEFPRVDGRVVGKRYRQLYHAARLSLPREQVGFDGIRRFDLETGETDAFSYGDGTLVEEHVFVPDRASTREGAGWFIGTALDLKRGQTVLSVFDAMALNAGPLAYARLPYALPLGLHGNFEGA
jgi:all-trans-8'-apo-beta-carotenal 15,15'-oxygenase